MNCLYGRKLLMATCTYLYQGRLFSLVWTVRVLLEVLRDCGLERFQLATLHLERLIDDVVWKPALQVDVEHQSATCLSVV